MQVVATAGPANGSVEVRVRGELDIATAPELAAELDRLLAARPRVLVLELGELTFLDCAGMRPVRSALRDLRCGGGTLVIRHASPLVERALRVAGLAETLDLGPVTLA